MEEEAIREKSKRDYARVKGLAEAGNPEAIDTIKAKREAAEITRIMKGGHNASWSKPEESVLLDALEKAGTQWEQLEGVYAEAAEKTQNFRSRHIVELKAKAKGMKLGYLEKGEDVPTALQCVPVQWPRRNRAFGKKYLRPQQRTHVVILEESSEDDSALVFKDGGKDEGVLTLKDSRKEKKVMRHEKSGWDDGEGVNVEFPLRADGSCVAVKDDSSSDGEPEMET